MKAQRAKAKSALTGFEDVNGDVARAGTTIDLMNVLDTIETPIVVVQRDCKVTCFNKAAADVLGLAPSDIHRASHDIPALAGLPRLEHKCSQVMTDGTDARMDLRDGNRWFVVRISPYAGADGQTTGTV